MQRVLTHLVARMGLAATLTIVRAWGGRTIRVPTKVEEGDPFALVLGLQTAQALVKFYADERLQLPDERRALLDLRNERIFKACTEDGRSQESVGIEYGLTRQGVAAVLRKVQDQRDLKAMRSQTLAGSEQSNAGAESNA